MTGSTLGPYDLNTIVTGDARELAKAIPDESVDLIFTDPVYDRIEDYEWLAETAARVLRPDRACLVWSNGKWHYRNTKWLDDAGLCHRWTFDVVMMGGNAPMNGFIIAKTNRVIWMDISETSRMSDYIPDGYASVTLPELFNHNHRWTKNPLFIAKCLNAFTQPNNIIFDPFTGGGTVPAVCKMLGRNYLAFEIDPDTADKARQRVEMTQPPLFVMQPEQMTLELEQQLG